MEASLDSINKAFEAGSLSDQMQRALEEKGIQKLIDFADYLQIYLDKSLDTSMRGHTREMIRDLFISDSVHVNISLSESKNPTDLMIKDFLAILPSIDNHLLRILIDSVEINKVLQRTGENEYAGSLKFIQRDERSSSINPSGTKSIRKVVDLFATRVRKQFGSDTLQIWKVTLGSIR